MLNVLIKNTFIFVPSQCDDASGGAAARRCKSAPPKMRSPPEEAHGAPPRDDGAETNEHVVAENNEMEDQVVEEGSEAIGFGDAGEGTTSEGTEHDGEKGSVAENVTGYTPTRGKGQPVASRQKIRPSAHLRQEERMIDRFLDEEISKVRAEKWDTLSRGLVELCTKKFSLNAVRIDMLVPERRLVINKLVMIHVAGFTGLTSEVINAMKEKSILREKGVTMEIWVAKRDAQNQELRVFLSAAVRFQTAFEKRQVLVQYRGVLPNLFLTESYTPMVPMKVTPFPPSAYLVGSPGISPKDRVLLTTRGALHATLPCRSTAFAG